MCDCLQTSLCGEECGEKKEKERQRKRETERDFGVFYLGI